MTAYYGVIYKDNNSDYGIAYPDMPGCISAAKTLEELPSLAREGLELHIEGLREDGIELPPCSSFDEIYHEAKDEEGFVGITLISVPPKPKQVRVNISLSEHELSIIDTTAATYRLNRSAFLVAAAKAVAAKRCKL